MTDLLILFGLTIVFGGKGIFLFIVYLLVKRFWPQIKEKMESERNKGRVINVREEEPSEEASISHLFSSFTNSFTPTTMPTVNKKMIALAIGLFIVLLIIIDGLVFVPAGNVGVIFDQGRGVLSTERQEGISLKVPFWQKAIKMDVRTQEYTMSGTQGEGVIFADDAMKAPTADGQTVTIDATVLFHVDKQQASDLYQNVGLDYIEKIVRTTARSQIRMVISRYTAIDIYSEKRQVAEDEMTKEIRASLAEKGIVLERVLLRNVTFGDQYATAIEEKQIAQQRIQKAEFERQEAEKVKETKIIQAQAEAEAIRLKGETLRANPQVIQFEFVQKMADDISWGILPDGVLPLMDMKSLGK